MSMEISNAPGMPFMPGGHAVAAPKAAAAQPVAAPASPISDVKAPQKAQVSAEEMQRNVREAVERLNEQMRKTGRNLNFAMDQQLDRMVITVKNSETGEVIRQIPDEAIVKAAHQIEALKGLLYNDMT